MFTLFSWPVPDHLSKDLHDVCLSLRSAKNQEDALRRAYDLLTGRFRARRSHTYIRIHRILSKDAEHVWSRTDFLHCTHMNWLLKILLVRSGWFPESDVRERWTLVWWMSPHQYSDARMKDGRIVHVDVWAWTYGVPFGEYAHGFNNSRLPVRK